MDIYLTNSFHRTGTWVRVDDHDLVDLRNGYRGVRLTAGQAQRTKRTLCGVTGCTCSGPSGVRVDGANANRVLEVVDPAEWLGRRPLAETV